MNASQQTAWRKSITVFDERKQQYEQFSLFPSDRPIPADEVNALSVQLSELRLVRPRAYGNCWLDCFLWEELELSAFWDAKLGSRRGEVPWRKVLQLLVVIQMVNVHIPTTDGRALILPHYTEPQAEQQMILEKLRLMLPAQPPPRI